ncbi:MAG: DUF2167 domain-containing protein [Planctomycetota bacterium]|nr:DUF2167 domain-containing protein [Planctomycetota bacterium]
MLALFLTFALAVPPGSRIQDSAPETASPAGEDPIDWILGPGEGQLGERAAVAIPEGFRFTGAKGTQLLLEAMENPTSGSELGLLANDAADAKQSWFVVFEFSESGYVKDEDRDQLDANALMETMKAGNERGNELRKQRGWETIELVGWKREPFYDPRTNNLTWATLARTKSGSESVNWSVRVLGREGVMNVDLVLAPETLDAALPAFEKVIDSFQYADGQRYAQFTAGDKVAEYGLAALVVGGGAAIAAKTGLLAKFWKFIVAGLVALAAAGKRFWSWLSGRRQEPREGETN